MEKKGEYYGDVQKWVEKVIDSCVTYEQTTTAERLVSNFDKRLFNKFPDMYWQLFYYEVINPLESKLKNKQEELLNENVGQ
jgi:hypothetical protein